MWKRVVIIFLSKNKGRMGARIIKGKADLREKLAIEMEGADWHAEKICREAQPQAEEKQREAEFVAEQKTSEPTLKGTKEMHAIQTALAESDAKIEVLQKYEYAQVDTSFIEVDEQAGETEMTTTFQPPLQQVILTPNVKQCSARNASKSLVCAEHGIQ